MTLKPVTRGVGLPLALWFVVSAAPVALAQVPVARPAFAAVSVKINPDKGATRGWNNQGGRFSATNIMVRLFISQAYDIRFDKVVDGPAWLSDGYDILATTGGPVPIQQAFAMLRTLLEDRFKLVTHREMRDEDVWLLVPDRKDGRLGPEIAPAKFDCVARLKEQAAAEAAAKAAGVPVPPLQLPAPGEARPCGVSPKFGDDAFTWFGGGTTMADIAGLLRPHSDRLIVDETGLAGRYDFSLRFHPAGTRTPLAGAGQERDGDAPPLMTAIREQLGLRLVPARRPAEVLVIDSVQRPAED